MGGGPSGKRGARQTGQARLKEGGGEETEGKEETEEARVPADPQPSDSRPSRVKT